MTLIFSNDNRLLFNIANSDQLLQLCYNNRFTALLDCKNEYKQPSTRYKTYLEKHIKKNFLRNQELDSLFKNQISKKTRFFYSPKNGWGTKTSLKSVGLLLHSKSMQKFLLKRVVKKGSSVNNQEKKHVGPCKSNAQIFCANRMCKSSVQVQSFLQIGDLYDKAKLCKQKDLQSKTKQSQALVSCKPKYGVTPLTFFRSNRKLNETALFDLVKARDTARLALQSFSGIEILSLYGLLQNQPVLLQKFFKNYFLLNGSKLLNQAFCSKALLVSVQAAESETNIEISNKFSKPVLFAWSESFIRDRSILQTRSIGFSRTLCNALELVNKIDRDPFLIRFGVLNFESERFRLHEKVDSKSLSRAKSKIISCKQICFEQLFKKLVSVNELKKLIGLTFITDRLAFLNSQVLTIKKAFPKPRIWGFAFGSSFLLVSVTSILQGQEQNRWFLNFSRNQMPGLSIASQESSLECFENITLKYLNRPSFGYKFSSGKGFVKQIECSRDIWDLSFSEFWNQQFFHNYTAVFSKPFEKTGLCIPQNFLCERESVAYKAEFLQSKARKEGVKKFPKKNIKTSIIFESLFLKERRKTISFRTALLPLFNFQFFSLAKDLSLKNKWLVQPWYKMHARTPPKKLQSALGSFSECSKKSWPFGRCKIALFGINTYKKKIDTQNDSIPSKMSSSTRVLNRSFICSHFLPSEALHLSNFTKNDFEKLFCSGKQLSYKSFCKYKSLSPNVHQSTFTQESCKAGLPHDRLKNLFYDWSNFSIDTSVLGENSQEADSVYDSAFPLKKIKNHFEQLIYTNRLSFLQEKNFFKGDSQLCDRHEKTGLSYPLGRLEKNFLQGEVLPLKNEQGYRSYQSYRHRLNVENGFAKQMCKSLPEGAYKSKAKLCKEICTGYAIKKGLQSSAYKTGLCKYAQAPKEASLLTLEKFPSCICSFPQIQSAKSKTSCYTNVKSSLSKSTERLSTYFLYKRSSISNRFMSGYQLPESQKLHFKKQEISVQSPKELRDLYRLRHQDLQSTRKTPFLSRVSIKVPPSLPFYESKIQKWRLSLIKRAGRGFQSFLGDHDNFSVERPIIGSLKRLPYRSLFLNCLQEVEPLFDQVNKAYRVSPYRSSFKKLLFTDYNDYLSWSKDTPVAIAITPSLEEEKAIKDSWFSEKAFSQGLKRETLSSSQDPFSPSLTHGKKENDDFVLEKQEKKKERERSIENKSLDNLQGQSETLPSSLTNKKKSKNPLSSIEDEALSTGEDDDKKKEVTKFEWLQQVREAERAVEKGKNFQKLAYPNREALFNKRLQVKSGMIQSLLVSDRKLSFFGITNLFPKRLVAQDQKQINSQILRDEQDRRSILLFEQAFLKNNDLETIVPNKKSVFIENFLKSGALYNLQQKLNMPPNSKEMLFSLRTKPRNYQRGNFRSVEKIKPCKLALADKKKPYGPTKQSFDSGEVLLTPLKNGNDLTNVERNPSVANILASTNQRFVRSFALAQPARARQHPIYTPNRRLRLCAPQLSSSSQSSNPQSRIDDLNRLQSHRWWQKRRIASSLLGAPSKRYLVMPEITPQNWRKIVEWQLKTYFLEEEKRLEPLILEKNLANKTDFSSSSSALKGVTSGERNISKILKDRPPFIKDVQNESLQAISSAHSESEALYELPPDSSKSSQTKRFFKIKKIAIYLPWITLKKSLNKPFEWPLTGLSYQSFGRVNDLSLVSEIGTESEILSKLFYDRLLQFNLAFGKTKRTSEQVEKTDQANVFHPFLRREKEFVAYKSPKPMACEQDCANQMCKSSVHIKDLQSKVKREKVLLHEPFSGSFLQSKDVQNVGFIPFTQEQTSLLSKKSFTKNKKPELCFVASISPHFKTSLLSLSNQIDKSGRSDTRPDLTTEIVANGLHETSTYKPFLFEARTKNSYLLLHQLLLAVATKQLFEAIYKLFGKVITHKIKNSSLAILLLPIFLNTFSRKNEISLFSRLEKRLKDLVGSEDTISSLSEIVWYLRNSCRGRMIPRGVVLVETVASDSTNYLKAIGGEAQVPVIVQSLRALPFTQNHPQRLLEKILTFAQKKAPCILFLDDLDSIGQSRTLLLKNNYGHLTPSKTETFSFPAPFNQIKSRNGETLEKRKWKKSKNDLGCSNQMELCKNLPKKDLVQSFAFHRSNAFKASYKSSCKYKFPICKKLCTCIGMPEVKENNVVQISETDKVIEQRRVDLMLRLLTVMDGITHLDGVLVVTTSKNPAQLDPALLRPGRFEKLINLELPNKRKRIDLLKMETAKIGHTSFMPWEYFGTQTQNMTGTEIASAVNHSAFRAIIQSTVHTFPTLEYGISRVRTPFDEHAHATGLQNGNSSGNQASKKCVNQIYKSWWRSLYKSLSPKGLSFASAKPCKASLCTCKPLQTKICKEKKARTICKALTSLQFARKSFVKKQRFLKTIMVHNPYTTVLREEEKLPRQSYKREIFLKKSQEITSQISFYQAGRGVVRSFTNNLNRAKQKKMGVSTKNAVFARNFYKRRKLCKTLFKRDRRNPISSYLAENVARLYAGQASLALYFDSIAFFKNKNFSDIFPQLLFLRSNLFYKEKIQDPSTIEKIATFYEFSLKADCFLTKQSFVKNRKQTRNQRLNKALFCKNGLFYKSLICTFTDKYNKRLSFANKYNGYSFLRKYLYLYRNNERSDSTLLYNLISKDYWWTQQVSLTLKTFKQRPGNWYRLYLPKVEQNKNNREWLLPDLFSNQHMPFVKQRDLQSRVRISQQSSKHLISLSSSRQKHFSSPPQLLCKIGVREQKQSDSCFSYYNLVLGAFYAAFQNCSENRELLDMLADHLTRFKIVRLHEVVRIGAFYF